MELALPQITNYRITLEALEDATLPALEQQRWLGSVLRGTLGNALRKSACVTRQRHCNGCAILSSCIYARFFEQVPGIATRPGQVLHPFAFHFPRLPQQIRAGEILPVELRLFGQARQDLGYFIHAMQMAVQQGLGRERARFEYRHTQVQHHPDGPWEEVFHAGAPSLQPPPCPERIHVRLNAPLRIKYQKRLVGAERLTGRIFLAQLWNRARALSALPGERVVLPGPSRAADSVRLTGADLRWMRLKRYSGRQQTEMWIDGLMGHFTLEGEELRHWWPLLWYGQWFQIGRLTSMGMGAYAVSDKLAEADNGPANADNGPADAATG